MLAMLKKHAVTLAGIFLFASFGFAQTSAIEGDVKGEDGQGLKGALVKIERIDIKGSYKVKTDKKGHFFHAGLPLGSYKVTVEVEGKDRDSVNGVRTTLGDPAQVNFDLQAAKRKQDEISNAAASGQLTRDQARGMTPEQKAAMEKALKDREAAMSKNKALNDAFNQGMEAMKLKQFDQAVAAFAKATEMDPKQHVVWGQLAEAYVAQAGTKTGQEQTDVMTKGLEVYAKALELKPDDAAYHNNFALALAKAKKFPEAQAELEKAAQLDPPNAGRYFYNLGAVLVNTGQIEPAGVAFKRAIEGDPNYADAQYQYGVYLISKAQTTPDGKVIPVPGTKEAFQKYLELKPDGPFADSAKGMLASMDTSLQTQFENPDAQKKKAAKKK